MHLTDNQSRQICRIAFLGLCILPTLLVLYAGWHVQTPADWELKIAARLNLDLRIEKVANPYPGTTVLHNVQLLDGPNIAGQFPRIIVEYLDDNKLMIPDGGVLQPNGLRLLSQRLCRQERNLGGWRLLCSNLDLPGPKATTRSSGLRIQEAEVLLAPDSREDLKLMRFRFSNSQNKTDFPLEFQSSSTRLPGAKLQRIVKLRAREDLPIWFLSALGVDSFDYGTDATFRGELEFCEADGNWAGKIDHGFLGGVELANFCPILSQSLVGKCDARVLRLTWAENKIHRANLEVFCKDGAINKELLAALGRIPNLEARVSTETQAQTPYEQLAFRIELMSGTCKFSPLGQATAICLDSSSQPLLQVVDGGPVQVDMEYLARICLEPCSPELLADDKLIDLLRIFHLPPDSRSARQVPRGEYR